jgi:hypothetical protein
MERPVVGFSLNLNDAWKAVRGVPRAVANVAEEALDAADYLADHPPSLDRFKRTARAVGESLRTGEAGVIHADLPGYAGLDAGELEEAKRRGEGRTIAQPYITGDRAGHSRHEPISLVVRGSLEDVAKALESQGWTEAPPLDTREALKMAAKFVLGTEKNINGPVSRMYVDGQEAVAAFNKNDDFNAGRDHLRIFSAGKDPKTGEPVWQIAATRDVGATITAPRLTFDGLKPSLTAPRSGHRTDPAIDRERDLIMHDMLASGRVKAWAAVAGSREGLAESRQPDGSVQIGQRVTDGLVYDVAL